MGNVPEPHTQKELHKIIHAPRNPLSILFF